MTKLTVDDAVKLLQQDTTNQPKKLSVNNAVKLLQAKQASKPAKDLGTMPAITVDAGEPSSIKSLILGAANDVGGGINQVVSSAKDLGSSAINKAFGTSLRTDRNKKVTQETQALNNAYEESRARAGESGTDWWRVAGNVAPLLFTGAAGVGETTLGTAARSSGLGALIGGTQFAENADQRLSNAVAGAVGGAAGGVAGHGIGKLATGVKRAVKPQTSGLSSTQATTQIDAVINTALKEEGVALSELRPSAQKALREATKKALESGKSPDARTLKRSAVFANLKAEGFDLKPTLKQATGNPKIWQQETELAKLAGSEKLTTKYVDDHLSLARLLDDAQVRTGGNVADKHQAGEVLLDSLSRQDAARRNYIAAMYDQAKNHAGNDLTLDPNRFGINMQQTLNESLLDIDNLPPVLLRRLNQYQTGAKPFTLTEKESLVKSVNQALGEMKGPATEQQRALMGFRKALESEVDNTLDAFGTQLQGEAKAAWEAARQAAAGRFGLIKRTPALKAALADIAPDGAFDKLVMKSSIRDLEAMKSELISDPATLAALKQQVIKHIADKSINANDIFSPHAMSSALKSIGDRRLAVLFTPKEMAHLKNIEAAGRYLISQPNQSYVNNSNTTAAATNLIGWLSKMPGIKQAVDKFVLPTSRSLSAEVKLSGGATGRAIAKTATLDAPKPLSGAEKELIANLERMGVTITPNMFRRQNSPQQDK